MRLDFTHSPPPVRVRSEHSSLLSLICPPLRRSRRLLRPRLGNSRKLRALMHVLPRGLVGRVHALGGTGRRTGVGGVTLAHAGHGRVGHGACGAGAGRAGGMAQTGLGVRRRLLWMVRRWLRLRGVRRVAVLRSLGSRGPHLAGGVAVVLGGGLREGA